jgi:branched-chain amino acid transport system substrate-binding protein
MKELPVNDFFTKDGRIRQDGRVLRKFYLMEVKDPKESKEPWDYLKLLETISAEQTATPENESECPFVKKT